MASFAVLFDNVQIPLKEVIKVLSVIDVFVIQFVDEFGISFVRLCFVVSLSTIMSFR